MIKNKIGLFGGTFNPIHIGHLNSMLTVAEKLNLEYIKVIPAREAPLRKKVQGPTPEQRLEMVKLGLKNYDDILKVDDVEILKSGMSFTIETLHKLLNGEDGSNYFLIIGADQFEKFDKWKNYKEILQTVNLIVTSRPGSGLPHSRNEIPPAIMELVDDYDQNIAILKSGREIHFIQLEDINISGTEIRKKIRFGANVENLMAPEVKKYIDENKLFQHIGPKVTDFEEFTHFCAQVLKDKNGIRIKGYDLRLLDKASEFTLIASGNNTRHVSALAEYVVKAVKDKYEALPFAMEGQSEGRWVVVDFGGLILHIFYDYIREEYRLEDLWKEGQQMELFKE